MPGHWKHILLRYAMFGQNPCTERDMSWNKLLQHPFTLKGVDGQDVAASLGSLMEARLENVGATLRLQQLHVQSCGVSFLFATSVCQDPETYKWYVEASADYFQACSHLLPLVRSTR